MVLLDEALIVLDADITTAEEGIRLSSELFLQNGYVKEGYAEAVIQREKIYPTGLPGKGIGIAIPHTDNKLVIKPGIGVIIPKRPIIFSVMGTKDQAVECELLLPLVIKDSKMQVTMLKKIMNIIQNGDLLRQIRDAKSKKEVTRLLGSLGKDE